MEEKKIKGRKRHIVVDSQGHLLDIKVTAANQHDTNAGLFVMDGAKSKHETIQRFFADSAYLGNSSLYAEILLDTPVVITKRTGKGFNVIPKRWVVERTFGWVNHDRRLSKDYEVKVSHSENMFRIAMIR